MLRVGVAAMAMAAAVLAGAPSGAQAAVTSSQITSWVSSEPGTPANSPYLISLDNPPSPTTVTVAGNASVTGVGNLVDVVCFYGSASHFVKPPLASNVAVKPDGSFNTAAVALRPIAGHACRLRAIPAGAESTGDVGVFAGPQVAVSEAALPLSRISGGPNASQAYNYYVNSVTLSGFAAWKAAGTNGCGPYAAPINPAFDIGNFALDCTGSLLSDDLGAWGGRSEVQIDGRNAYDAASAQALFPRTNGLDNGSEDLLGFPSVTASVDWDPSSGLVSTRSQESWVGCSGSDPYKPTSALACPRFVDTGVRLERDVTTGGSGRVVTLTDTWSSTDEQSHTLDLLYDDYVGVFGNADGERGYQFPAQAAFSQYGAGGSVPGPTSTPGSILVRTNVTAPDGDPGEGFGAITFGSAPAGFRFASNSELEEHNVLVVPPGGSTSLTYVYSVGYSLADVRALALAAQDRFQEPAVAITSPANGATVSNSTVNLAGTATAGSGISSLSVAGQPVAVAPGGAWSARVPLKPGTNTITVVATDGAGATAQAQLTVVYQPAPVATCKVPRTKGLKLAAAERALRRAHCRVGKIKRVRSAKIGRGRVMSSTPRSGRRLRAGARIELFVSRGP
jgi:Glucodextranase, domain B/PASTA domain